MERALCEMLTPRAMKSLRMANEEYERQLCNAGMAIHNRNKKSDASSIALNLRGKSNSEIKEAIREPCPRARGRRSGGGARRGARSAPRKTRG